MRLSFVILTHHRGPLLQQCLDSIYMQQGLPLPFEIIVIDNGGDAQFAPPPTLRIRLHVEKPHENLGASGGRNLGISLAQGQYIIFMDDDACWHNENDVHRLLEILDSRPTCGAVATKSLAPDNQLIYDDIPHPNKAYLLSKEQPADVPYFYSFACAVRADALKMAGGYPHRYQIYMEEVDLSLRIINAGYQILYHPQVVAVHHRSENGRMVYGDKFWFANALNKTRMAWRLLPHPYPLTTLVAWSLRVLLKTHKPKLVLKLWRDLWQERALLQQERAPIQPQTVQYLKQIGGRLLY